MSTDITDINIIVENSTQIGPKLDTDVKKYIQALKSDISHKHVTHGILLYEIVMLTEYQNIPVSDQYVRDEEFVNSLLREYDIDISVIDNLAQPSDMNSKFSGESQFNVRIPDSLAEYLNKDTYHKSSYIEDRVIDYSSKLWNSRSERITFKKELYDIVSNSGSIDDSISESTLLTIENFDAIQDIIDSQKEWYVGSDIQEIENNIIDKTKETQSDRVPVLEYIFKKRISHMTDFIKEHNTWAGIDSSIENMVMEEDYVAYVEELLDVSRPTAQRYTDAMDMYWEETTNQNVNKVKKQLIEDNIDEFVTHIVKYWSEQKDSNIIVVSDFETAVVHNVIEDRGGKLSIDNTLEVTIENENIVISEL